MTTILTILLYALAAVGAITVGRLTLRGVRFAVSFYHALQIRGLGAVEAAEYIVGIARRKFARVTAVATFVQKIPLIGGLIYRLFFAKRVEHSASVVKGGEQFVQMVKTGEEIRMRAAAAPLQGTDFNTQTVH